jgi:hypothetical protein
VNKVENVLSRKIPTLEKRLRSAARFKKGGATSNTKASTHAAAERRKHDDDTV